MSTIFKKIFILLFTCTALLNTVSAQNLLLGDSDSNGIVNIVDALMIAQYTVGQTMNNINLQAADTNVDNVVNIVDALIVAQFCVGLITEMPPLPQGSTEKFTLTLRSTTDNGDMSLTPTIKSNPVGVQLSSTEFSYPAGTLVSLSVDYYAVNWMTGPHPLVTFTHWIGNPESSTNSFPVTATVLMDADKTIIAYYHYTTFDDTP